MQISLVNKTNDIDEDKEGEVLEHISDTLLNLSEDAIQLALQLKENSSQIEQLIAHVTQLSSKVKQLPKGHEFKDANIASAYWAFE